MIQAVINIFSTARSKILAELKTRPYTASELSKITGYSKATIFYHLERLNKAGYVKRVERGKWVYYSLTENGVNALRYEVAKMVVLFVGGITSLVYGALLILTRRLKELEFVVQRKEIEEVPKVVPKAVPFDFTECIPYLFIVAGITLITAFLILRFSGNVPLKSERG
ncbi:hypothetical protein DRO97_10195 [Archaeoglobales archaeon]|nr:MAG: hypothetical protein DRO97_10195 [Archaeoglobales archaeon]